MRLMKMPIKIIEGNIFVEMFHYEYALFLMTNNYAFNSEIHVTMFKSCITHMEMQSVKDKEYVNSVVMYLSLYKYVACVMYII